MAGALTLVLVSDGWPRLLRFACNPTTPYGDVRARLAERYSEYGRILGVANPSLLTHDVGALLDRGGLRVHDLCGLTEPAATRTLRTASAGWRTDHHPEFYDWVFEEIRPTFIASRGDLNQLPDYERDPRFARDYAAIESWVEGDIVRHSPFAIHSGDFVRRDVLKDSASLEALRSRYRVPARRPTSGWRIVDAWKQTAGNAPTGDRLREEAALVMVEWKDYDRAAALYEAVLDCDPHDELALAGLAGALDRAGRAYEARPLWIRRRDLERVKGIEADARLLRAIENRLDDPRRARSFPAEALSAGAAP